MEHATFAAGCFWGVEAAFQKIIGVKKTTVGYMGGTTKDPTYEQVCTNRTGHAEVVRIEFNSAVVSYKKLLDVFWQIHDPTQRNRQGPDIGTQYRSAIFYETPMQKKLAEESKKHLERSRGLKESIATEIVAASAFYPAEEYHQKYFQKKGLTGFHI
jgi:peptide-methionine (S)-S-oxide reductase